MTADNEREIKVMIADDHALMREGLVKILSIEPNIKVSEKLRTGIRR